MNPSAKLTAFSFLAAAALGAMVFTGCTVTSGTNDDTDGGTQNNDKDANPDTTDDDAGTDEEPGAVCESKQKFTPIVSAECQSCLNTSCCTELTSCFSLSGDDEAGTVDCNDYASCVADCRDVEDEGADSCYENCDLVAAEGVQDAYEKIVACASSNDDCKTACGVE